MEEIAAPDSVDLREFQFKLHRRVQIFDPATEVKSDPLDLVTTASKFGLLFIGAPDRTLRALHLRDLLDDSSPQCPQRIIPLPSVPVHISLNCDCEFLSVVIFKNDTPVVLVYNTKSLITVNPVLIREIRLSATPNVHLCRLLWNPCQADSLAVCMSDGSLSIFSSKATSLEVQTVPSNAKCLSWSPKGKQIVTGNSDGTLKQYKPDLTLVKTIPATKLFNVTSVLSVHWISNYQFCAVYEDVSNPGSRPCVVIVNTPKNGNCSYVNYDDICYSSGNERSNQYFLVHVPLWGVLLSFSANSVETGVLGTLDQSIWQQWTQMDEARAELPLTDDKQESYPIGVSFDNSALIQLPWEDGQMLPHMPMVHILSHTGILVSFFMINLMQNAVNVCIAPEVITIPTNLLTLEYPRIEKAEPKPPVSASSNMPDFSFHIAPNTMTSTPTVPKNPNNVVTKPISTNLFANVNKESPPKDNFAEVGTNNGQSMINTLNKHVPTNTLYADVRKEKIDSQEQKNFIQTPPQTQEFKTVLETTTNINFKNINNEKTNEPVIKSVPSEAIKSMLLSEVNNFQKERFELLQRCRNVKVEIGNDEERNRIKTVLTNNDKILTKSDCILSTDDIKQQMTILTHNLISTCAFLAEARMQPASLELEQLAQLDPASANKMTSIKLMSYYVESQLQQVNSALNEQWETFQRECKQKAQALHGVSNDCMKMPTLEKIYQPLLKQSEILVKQQNIIASLQNTIDGMDLSSITKNSKKNLSTLEPAELDSNANKTFSWLAKSMNNMNLQPKNSMSNKNNPNSKKSEAKYNALRKLLVDVNTVKIKPVKIEPPSVLQSFQDWQTTNNSQNQTYSTSKEPLINNANVVTSSPVVKLSETTVSNGSIQKNQTNNVTSSSVKPSNPLQNLNDFVTKSTIQNNVSNVKSVQPPQPVVSFEKPQETVTTAPYATSAFQNIFGAFKEKIHTADPKPSTVVPPNTVPSSIFSALAVSKPPTTSFFTSVQTPNLFTVTTSSPVNVFPSTLPTMVNTTKAADKKEIAPVTAPVKDVPKSEPIYSFKLPESTSLFPISTSSNTQTKTFSFSLASSNTPSLSTSTTLIKNVQPSVQSKSTFDPTEIAQNESLNKEIGSSNPSALPKNMAVSNAGNIINQNQPFNLNTVSKPILANTPNVVSSTDQSSNVVKGNEKPATISVFNNMSLNTTPKSTLLASPPSNTSLLANETVKTSNTPTIDNKTEPNNVSNLFSSTINVSSTVKPFDKTITELPFGAAKTAEPTTLTTPPSNLVSSSPFGFPSSVAPAFSATSLPSLIPSPTAAVTTTTTTTTTATASSIFGGSPLVSTTTPFATSTIQSPSIFGSPTASANSTPANLFGSPAAVNTCASSLFGAANAAIDTSVASLFGSASISTTTPQSPFGTANKTTGSIFGSGSAVFGGQTTFSSTGASIFGGNTAQTFGQPQGNPVFGSNATFGAFGASSQPSNIFGQAVQSANAFSNPNQSSLFGDNTVSKSAFGSPAPSPQQSVFGSPTATAAPVFGGSPTFGSKPVFGQTASFGSSPSGSFGLFGSTDQASVAQSGFGSPGGFNKSNDAFGGSPKFGGSPSFGSPSFGTTSPFGGGATSAFGSSPGFGGGTQQSSTFENLATQSTISFGNLAQQSQQNQQQSPPMFQSSSSFSTWRS